MRYQEWDMRIAIVGQKDFGKAALDAFVKRGDTVAGVFCAPEKPGEAADPLRLGAEQLGIPVFALPSLRWKRRDRRSSLCRWIWRCSPMYCNSCPRISRRSRGMERFNFIRRCCRVTGGRV